MPLLSIIIPLYNKEHCIRQTLFSILSQSYRDFEIVIVNDGSKDKSVDVVNSINDDRIRLINKENEGVSKTRNRGIKEAKGEWIMFLDADDLLIEDSLQALVSLLKKYPNSNVLCGNYITRTTSRDINSSVIENNCLIQNPYELIWKKQWNLRLGSFIAKKEIVPFFDENMSKGEDVLFCFELLVNGIVSYIPSNIMIYVKENSSLSIKLLPLENSLSWSLCFKNSNSYLKSIYVDILLKSIIVYTCRYRKINYSYRLFVKHFKNLFQYTPQYIYRKLFNK